MEKSRKNQSKSAELVCPSCGRAHGGDDRFCSECGMPLVQAGGFEPVSPQRERARKIDPLYTQGELVRVGYARHQAEADLLQNMLLEEGIPSLTKRSVDVPDFLAAGPRDIYVPASGAELARGLLGGETTAAAPLQTRLVLAVLGGGLLAALAVWLFSGGGPS